uniref:Uncharacterized protein n=1 Tax=Rhizophora mucronata TaxID=61149 RepID=A0A2P2PGB5_RHIMU
MMVMVGIGHMKWLKELILL